VPPLVREPDWLKLYQSEARPRLSVETVFGPLPGQRITGDRLRAPCPLHGGKSQSFAIEVKTLHWFCHSKCGSGGDPIDFLHRLRGGSGAIRGRAFIEILKELCGRAGVSPQPPDTAWASRAGRAATLVPPSLPDAPLDSREVEAVWNLAYPVTADVRVARWLSHERSLDPATIARLDLARVLPPRADLPQWAGFQRDGRWRSWPSVDYRVIVPLVDNDGRLRSLRFRAPRLGAKGRSATGVTGVGLVMADSVAIGVLESGLPPPFWDCETFTVVLAEGEPDFWSWATEPARRGLGHGAMSFPPVFGVVSGSFDESIAARLPTSTHVISAVDRDEGGDRIHARLARTLADADRDFSLSRWIPA